MKGLNEKWHILDKFPQKTDINTDFCVFSSGRGHLSCKSTLSKALVSKAILFHEGGLNSDLEQKNASSNCDLWEVSLHITEELWITAFLMNVTSLNPSDLQNSQMF